MQQFNTIKEELPLAKPGWQRRKHDAKKEIPEQLKQKNGGFPLTDHKMLTSELPSEPEQVMDLSLGAGHRARSFLERPLVVENIMTPPKKRRFAQQICDTNSPVSKHITLPPR